MEYGRYKDGIESARGIKKNQYIPILLIQVKRVQSALAIGVGTNINHFTALVK